MKKTVLLASVLLLLSGMMAAQQGLFATTPFNADPNVNGPWVTVQSGPSDDMGPYVDVASISIPQGEYLLTGYVQTFSYLGNAGVDCAFYVNHVYGSAVGGDRLNGSGDGTYAGRDKSTFLGKYRGMGGTLTISCLKTYGKTDWSLLNGTLQAIRVTALRSNP
jgi:hypothetical protein